MAETQEKLLRLITGRVISNKMNKTAVVLIERRVRDPLYGKYLKKSTKYSIHDENNECQEGDLVSFTKTRPYSKLKHWCLHEVLEVARTAV